MERKFYFPIMSELLAPADTTVDEPIKDLSIEDVISELGDDEDKLPDDDSKIKGDLLADDDKSEKEDEEETEEEPEKEDEELEEISDDVPARKLILKEFPDIFKKFPGIEAAIYRERKYTELLPTIEDAKQAVERSEKFEEFSQNLLSGNLDGILTSVKSADEGAYGKIVDNYLETLGKVDREAYIHVITNISKNTIYSMVKAASEKGDDDVDGQKLAAAAIILNQFLFQSSTYKPPVKFSKTSDASDEESNKLKSERQQFEASKLTSAVEDVGSRIENSIKSTISKHIDPKGSMTDYVKRVAISDAITDVRKLIGKDARFKATLDKLWVKAASSGYSQESRNAIKSAYFNKATTLLPSVIKTHRNAALKGLGKRVDDSSSSKREKDDVDIKPRASGQRSSKSTEIPDKKMSTLDFLNSD